MYELISSFSAYSDRMEVFVAMCIAYALAVGFFLLVVAPVHNYAKVRVAKAFGDHNIKNRSCYTLSPKKSIHIIGVFSLLVLNIGFTEPVNYKRNRFYRPVMGTLSVSFTGPAVYFAFTLVAVFIYSILKSMNIFGISVVSQTRELANPIVFTYFLIYALLYFVIRICMMSAIFNLIPMIPLDMGDLLKIILRPSWIDLIMNNQILVALAMFIFAFLTIGKPDGFIDEFSNGIINNMVKIISVPMSWALAIFF